VCGGVFPAASGRRYAGAASFFGAVPAGMKLVVRAPDGSVRDVTVPAESDAQATDCTDPFSRDRAIYAEAKVRPDGVAVIRLPSFFPFDKQFPTTATQAELEAFVAAYQAEIQKVFDTVKSAPGIVWDTRGNTGGITSVGAAITGGFPSARTTAVSYCRDRIDGAFPIAYSPQHYAIYGVEPGGPFAYAGKVAVVTDGLAYSAGDYFPRFVAKASDVPVVGSASAGAYGGGHIEIAVDGPPKLEANYDPTACFDAVTNAPLEGAPLAPKVPVEYDPSDLSAGKDTIVERAVKELAL
jgi:C-terminal processing protease CtpA/Prc